MKSLLKICAAMVLASATAQAQDDNPQVTLHTSKGDIRIELFEDKAPVSVENFLQYARDGFYGGTIFHRVISHFMIQGGGYDADMQRKPTREPITNEADNGLSNQRGTVAMARTMVPDSATAQFFINLKDNTFLDAANARDGNGYAVFGKVVSGMEVVDKIKAVPTGNRGAHQNVPLEPVTINKAILEK